MMYQVLNIKSDGTPQGTTITDETGKPFGGSIKAIEWSISTGNLAEATVHCIGTHVAAKRVRATIVDVTDVTDLRFNALRGANVARLPQFKDGQGRRAHTHDLGFDWPLSKWMNAVHGECGEAANLIKKIERGDFTLEDKRHMLADELADVICYLDLLAIRAEIDLGEAVISKFNAVSKRVGSDVRLEPDAWFHSPGFEEDGA